MALIRHSVFLEECDYFICQTIFAKMGPRRKSNSVVFGFNMETPIYPKAAYRGKLNTMELAIHRTG
jgi:hypothetical protein